MNHDAKETALEAIREHGVMMAGAEAAGVTIRTLNNEMKRSAIFKKRILEAREEGKRNMSDNALQLVKDYAEGKYDKTDRNRLLAALALLNWAEPGFRGTTHTESKVHHDVRVISAVPRPKYEIISIEKKLLDKPSPKMLKSKRVEIRDENGNYIGTKVETVEEAIEGEVIKESE